MLKTWFKIEELFYLAIFNKTDYRIEYEKL